MKTFDYFKNFLSYVNIISDIPGRIRLKLDPAKLTSDNINELMNVLSFEDVIKSLPGIKAVRVNLPAFSCVIEYDSTIFNQKSWFDAVNGTDSNASNHLLSAIENHFNSWKEQTF